MTPEERLEAHEQWLLDHDRAHVPQAHEMAEIRTILLHVAQLLDRLLGRDTGGAPPDAP